MLQGFVKIFGGDPHKREIQRLGEIVTRINALENDFENRSDEALLAMTKEFRTRIATATDGIQDENERFSIEQDILEQILPEAFAAVREASKRTIGLRHFDVQLVGGIVLHRGQISEMRTGEGKTLVATLPLYLNALTGRGAHLITVNDYLARRDARWMGPIYHLLGLKVGVLQMAAVTENGKKAFLYDPARESPHEDQHQLNMVPRLEAYQADITYGTNSEFGFDYLRDNMTMRLGDRVQRGYYYAIVDEVDNVLIDEARTPLIISGPAAGDVEWYGRMVQVVRQLRPEDYEVIEKDRTVTLTEIGTVHVEQLLGQPLRDPDRPEDVTPEQARLLGYLEQALKAQFLFRRNKDYLVQGGKVIIVDEFTGRLMPGRRWSDGLHQAVEAKEGVRVEPENITYATITIQNYFRMYRKLAGMTGTALTEAEEFSKIYKLEVVPVPTNLEYVAAQPDSPLLEVKARDEDGYEFFYFARRGEDSTTPVFWRRKDYPDVIYRTSEAKLRAIVKEIVVQHVRGRPLLVGTTSVESSERLSSRLRAEPVRRLMQISLVRHAWLKQNDRVEDGRLIEELQPLNEPLDKIDPSRLRQFAKPLGISINPEDPENLKTLCEVLGLREEDQPRLRGVLQGGVPHQVLNARKHTEESQIIAGAGAFGAVTIATNMAGRGVDIRLGGELAEEVILAVNRVLKKAGHAEPYEMSLEARRQALQKMEPAQYGIYESEVGYFLKYFNDMERVKELGGLHVIGSERHEARRIDNQLRGRSARQGDPGSSRFFLSLEDDLMRLFGSTQVNDVMQRMRIDDAYPLEHRMVSGVIEQSQHRVEGANFDVRKHLLEYDDVLNSQRMRIFGQRDRVFTKEDLNEDITELLRLEVQRRVSESLEDEEGPWRLLAWLDQIQPPIMLPDGVYPSYAYRLLQTGLSASGKPLREAVLQLVKDALQAEHEHLLRAIQTQVARTGEGLKNQIWERSEALDNYLDASKENESGQTRRPQQILEELSSLLGLPLRLPPEQLRLLVDDPQALADPLHQQMETSLTALTITRLLGTLEYRLGESLGTSREALLKLSWEQAADQIVDLAKRYLEKRLDNFVGNNGQVVRDLEAALQHEATLNPSEIVRLLATLAQGRRTFFDAKTHRQVQQVTVRFHYVFLAARLLEGREPDQLSDDIIEHLQGGRHALRRSWGTNEYTRLSQNATRIADLGPATGILNSERLEAPLASLSESEHAALVEELGRRAQTEIDRQVLLGVITELWVDYLTRLEALRISIGLEAYAQRDPLVQYKSQASEMFQNLLGEVRTAVVSRVFLYQPRMMAAAQVEAASPAASNQAAQPAPLAGGGKKKRKRH